MRVLLPLLFTALLFHAGYAQHTDRLEFTHTITAGQPVYLANYYGNRLYHNDTAMADAQGRAVFARKGGYEPGLYAVLMGSDRMEVVLNEPVVRVALDPQGKVKVLESRENRIHHVERKTAEAQPEPRRTKQLLELAHKNPDTFAAQLIRMDLEPETSPVLRVDGSLDSVATADRRRAHYWDNTVLTDERIVRSPAFQNRLDVLVATGLPQQPEPVAAYLDSLMARTGNALEVRRFIAYWATEKYVSLPTEGLGTVYVRMAQRHVCGGPNGTPGPDWSAPSWRAVCEKAARKAPLVVGEQARDIVLADTTEQNWIGLHAMPQACVVVVFWSPHCSHCKKTLPVLHDIYQRELQPLDIGIYTVAETRDSLKFADWKHFLHEQQFTWTNVGVPYKFYQEWNRNPGMRATAPTTVESVLVDQFWEVTGTPRYFILDRDRRMLARPTNVREVIDISKAYQAKGTR